VDAINGGELQGKQVGEGPPALFLHGEDGLLFAEPFLDRLAERFTVSAPLHPGWGTARAPHVRTLDDVAYGYLDLLESFDAPVVLIGASIGGWLAAEIATKNQTNVAALVLVAPVGIKTGGREDRAFVDIWATDPAALRDALYAEPGRAPSLAGLSDEQFVSLATAQEAVTRYGWEPYLHNPALPSRLHRITVPTLVVSGSADRFVLEDRYFDRFAAFVGDNARTAVLDAGHRVEEEAPDALAEAIGVFAKEAISRV
jgi:pimeloyl-ACP methyl ester carboxylesterase